MEELLTQAFSTGDLKIIVVAVILYGIIKYQRDNTGKKRDDASENFDKRISLLESDIKELKELDLSAKLAQIIADLAWLKDKYRDK